MSAEISKSDVPVPTGRFNRNRIFFPTALRDAIPDLPTFLGRELTLDSTTGRLTHVPFLPPPFNGPRVQLDFVAKETGKLSGQFTIRVDLAPEAARALAETLTRLSNQAEASGS